MRLDNNQQAFLALVRFGLWESDAQLSKYGKIDYMEVYRLAEEQSVVGIVAAGLEHVTDVKVPQGELLHFVGSTLQLERRNKAMNTFIAKLIEKLRRSDIYALLLKGQGIAQCYERPLWRSSGDVDLLLSDENYTKAERLLSPLASQIDEEISYAKHKALTIHETYGTIDQGRMDGWIVELHGLLRSGLWRKVDRVLDRVQYDILCGGNVRSWLNGNTQVFMPRADEDVVFVFSHILGHFFKEGIGLRQICDWCRLLWIYRDNIDESLLKRRLCSMGAMTEWKTFAYLAVNTLGAPKHAIPFYEKSKRWQRQSEKVLSFIVETGNFGHNRDYSYQKKNSFIVYKTISLWKHIKDYFKHSLIFPVDSLKVMTKRICYGVKMVIKQLMKRQRNGGTGSELRCS